MNTEETIIPKPTQKHEADLIRILNKLSDVTGGYPSKLEKEILSWHNNHQESALPLLEKMREEVQSHFECFEYEKQGYLRKILAKYLGKIKIPSEERFNET